MVLYFVIQHLRSKKSSTIKYNEIGMQTTTIPSEKSVTRTNRDKV